MPRWLRHMTPMPSPLAKPRARNALASRPDRSSSSAKLSSAPLIDQRAGLRGALAGDGQRRASRAVGPEGVQRANQPVWRFQPERAGPQQADRTGCLGSGPGGQLAGQPDSSIGDPHPIDAVAPGIESPPGTGPELLAPRRQNPLGRVRPGVRGLRHACRQSHTCRQSNICR